MQQPRQMYGLGSLVKSATKAVKGVAKGVKDFAKSDLGKAALLTAGAYYAPAMFSGTVGFGPNTTYGGFLRGLPGASSVSNFFEGKDLLSKGNVASGIIGLSSFLAAQGVEEDEIEDIQRDPEKLSNYLGQYYKNLNPSASPQDVANFVRVNTMEYRSDGGRIGYSGGSGKTITLMDGTKVYIPSGSTTSSGSLKNHIYSSSKGDLLREEILAKMLFSDGGRAKYALGDKAEDNAIQASGIMGLPLNQNPAGVTELDLRDSGGFIPPVGVKEKEDDIPAMLSNNEFVFTADAVRGMGDGDVNKGAERMYSMMKTLENGGRV